MDFPCSDQVFPESDSLSLGLMLDIKTEQSLLDDDSDSSCHQTSDLCKELSPSSSECLFANLPLFGERGLELSQDCASCLSDCADSGPSTKVPSPASLESEEVKNPPKKKKKKQGGSAGDKDSSKQAKPFVCPVCLKGFIINSNMIRHFKQHGDKPFKCDQCDKRFALSTNYESHMRFHNGIKPYICEICQKSFSWSGGYHRHQRIHFGFRPYSCGDCGKEFSDTGNYNNHRRVHTGERPHVCLKCGKGFSRSDSLNRHMITHSHIKMFECTQCGHEFKHLESLNKHCRRIHEVLKPLKRDECLKQNHRSDKSPKKARTKE